MLTIKHLLITSLCMASSAFAQLSSVKPEKTPAKFDNIESIAEVIPPTVNLKVGGKWNVAAVEQANNAVSIAALNQPATLRLRIQVFEPFKENGWGYRIMAPDDRVSVRGTMLPYRVWAYFRPEQGDALTKVRKGGSITVSGALGRADIKMYGEQPVLAIDLLEAKVEPQ